VQSPLLCCIINCRCRHHCCAASFIAGAVTIAVLHRSLQVQTPLLCCIFHCTCSHHCCAASFIARTVTTAVLHRSLRMQSPLLCCIFHCTCSHHCCAASFLAGAVTSGELTHRYLLERPTEWWAGLGSRCIHITWGQRGAVDISELNLQAGEPPDGAGWVAR
jgi:hypothetical protein